MLSRKDKMMIELTVKGWCTCIQRGVWKPQDGWRLDQPSGLWVHPRCSKPSYMNYQRFVEKKPIIAETRDMSFMKGEVDIYQKELSYWAKSVNYDILGWDIGDVDDEEPPVLDYQQDQF